MRNLKGLVLVTLFMLVPAYAHSEDYGYKKEPMVTPYVKEKAEEKAALPVSAETGNAQAESAGNAVENVKAQKQIKAQSICIGKDCRKSWPVFKCANYGDRPAGETGDEFCGKMKQTCLAVSIGGGQGFFEECSVAASSVHKCRCCWVE